MPAGQRWLGASRARSKDVTAGLRTPSARWLDGSMGFDRDIGLACTEVLYQVKQES